MKSLFKKYIQSNINPEEFDEFTRFIADEKQTQSVYGLMNEEWQSQITNDTTPRKNPLLFYKIQQVIYAQNRKSLVRKLNVYKISARIAAVLIVGLLLSSIWMFRQKELALSNSPVQTVKIPYGAKTQFQLPDGSSVWLNSGSSLSYSANFTNDRKVELQGEAFFDVIKNKIPFLVKTKYGSVTVLGTAFNIQAFDDGEFTTTLERGSVAVETNSDHQKITLKPGEQSLLFKNKLIKSEVDTKIFTSWKDGKLVFAREPFPEILKRLERWYNVKIDYSATDFGDLWFSGTIENETLTEVLEMICKAAPVMYSYNSQMRKVKIESIKK